MLKRLFLKNIALIASLELEFGAGLNVLSGETGAGKSVVIDGLNFILGERGDKTMLRHGEAEAVAEAVFEPLSGAARAALTELFGEDDETLVVSRTMNAEGRSEIRINGRAASLSMLKRVGGLLVDVHGQHEHQSLLKVSSHARALDYFAGAAAGAAKEKLRGELKRLREICAGLKKFGGDGEERARRLDLLKYQIDEIENAAFTEGEERDLTEKRDVIANRERIVTALSAAAAALGGEGGISAADALSRAADALSQISRFSSELEEIASKLDSAADLLSEVTGGVSSRLDDSADDGDADAVSERIELLKNLKRKYGGGIREINAFSEKARAEYEVLSGGAEAAERLYKEKEAALDAVYAACVSLGKIRRSAAVGFEAKVAENLSDLGMKNAAFKVEFQTAPTRAEVEEKATENGFDAPEFFLSANQGEPLKPLARIISGGEMSRLALALKNISADADDVPTMIFDEIDTGISGKIGQAVACKMADIARARQVVCVTHMPQIAAMADRAFLISKETSGGKTVTRAARLTGADFAGEVGRLTGGRDVSARALAVAEDMIKWSAEYKRARRSGNS